MDQDHNRSVVTFAGTRREVGEAAFLAIAKAAELIDMRLHRGKHPRMGATDVVPFIPISGVNMDDCVKLAHQVGERIAKKLDIPVYLYEEAATRPERRNLANVRRGEYEGLQEAIKEPERKPDFGPAVLNPKSGATVVGARRPLVAYNVYLNTGNLEIAQKIARAVRERNGGLTNVKAIGLYLENRKQVQVSMNLVNCDATPIHRVFELIRIEALHYGVSITDSELIGLIPLQYMLDAAAHYLRLENFSDNQVLEKKIFLE